MVKEAVHPVNDRLQAGVDAAKKQTVVRQPGDTASSAASTAWVATPTGEQAESGVTSPNEPSWKRKETK
jgi:hypothetical protein